MRVVVIGATGHIGSYLVPRLVEEGFDVVAISRGQRRPYRDHPAWDQVTQIVADRDAEDAAGTFGRRVAELKADGVVDLICYTPESAAKLVEGLGRSVGLLVSCGSIWVHGPGTQVPTREDAPRRPFGWYGTAKAEIEKLLLDQSKNVGTPAAVLHPGHITGPGWPVINPAGNLDLDVWNRLATGQKVTLPNFGLETVHHVHAADVAEGFVLALQRPRDALSQSFHIVSEQALTLRGFAEAVAGWFGQEANLEFLPFDEFRRVTAPEHAAATWEHISRSPSISMRKAEFGLEYEPEYTSLQAVREAVEWMQAAGWLKTGPLQAVS